MTCPHCGERVLTRTEKIREARKTAGICIDCRALIPTRERIPGGRKPARCLACRRARTHKA